MLSERDFKLLTAYVDGELDAPQRQALARLVAASPEARTFLEKLEGDSSELRALPAHKAPPTLADALMETVSEIRVAPTSAPPPHPVEPPARPIPRWLGVAVAASVLVAVGMATFLLTGVLLRPRSDPFMVDVLAAAAANFADPVADEDIGVQLPWAQMEEGPVQLRLVQELKKQPGFWFDVPATNDARAVDRLTAALKMTGIVVLMDNSTKVNLVKHQPNMRYALYAENLTQEEVARVFQNLAKAEQQATTPMVLNCMLMTEINEAKRTTLAAAMHVEPKLLDPTSKGLSLPNIIADPAGPNVKLDLPGKVQERLAMLLTLTNAGNPAASPQLREFLTKRQGLRQGTLQVVMLIHEQNT
jgi:hypothetical protein